MFFQLADAPQIDSDLPYWSRHFRKMPGEGDLNVTDFMHAVVATGYTGPVSREIFTGQMRGGVPQTIAKHGHWSLIELMDDMKREEPGAALDLTRMPVRAGAEGIAVVEFTTKGDDVEAL